MHMFPQQHAVGTTYQGFMKLLRRWTESLIQPVMIALRNQMQNTCSNCMQVAGFVLFAVDGSRAELPRTKAHERVFSSKKKRQKAKREAKSDKKRRRKSVTSPNTKKSEKPAMWLTTLWHVGSGLPWDWRLGPTDSSERAHWMEMLSSIEVPAMFVGDAGFVGYEYAAAVLNAGHQLTIRVGSHVTLLKRLGYARENADMVYLWPDKAAKRQGLPPLLFRLVVSHNGRHPIYLITSVVSKSRLSNIQVLAIYKQRWGIELFYRHLKQTFNKRKLRSAAPDQAYVEMHWSLLGLWCMGLYALKELLKAGKEPKQLSFAKLIRAFRRTIRDYLHPRTAGKCLLSLLRSSLKDDYCREDKTSREYPQKKKEKPPGKPKICLATSAQQQLALKIKAKIGFTA
ncbi:MAG: transposase [bacterium]|nr:transposase [bacterium]